MHALQARHLGGAGGDVVTRRVGAVAFLRDERDGAHAVQQFDDLADRVIAMQGRAADERVPRARQQRDEGLGAARHPQRDTLAATDAAAARSSARLSAAATTSRQDTARPRSRIAIASGRSAACRAASAWSVSARQKSEP
jgi:hypothetical protein